MNGTTRPAPAYSPPSRGDSPVPSQGRGARRRRAVAIALAVVALLAGGSWWAVRAGPSEVAAAVGTPTAVPVTGLVVRGVVRPAAWSRVGTHSGGVVTMLAAESGEVVNEGQVLARVRSPLDGSVEVVSAPRAGTVTARAVSLGDSSVPGSTLFVVSDLSSLRIEVADVDEFTVARVHRGQRAVVAVPALEVQGVSAIVRSVGAQPVGASVPDPSFTSTTDHYPVTVDLMEPVPGLHIGMAVRLRLDE